MKGEATIDLADRIDIAAMVGPNGFMPRSKPDSSLACPETRLRTGKQINSARTLRNTWNCPAVLLATLDTFDSVLLFDTNSTATCK